MSVRLTDRARMAALLAVRRVNAAAIERWSTRSWARMRRAGALPLDVVSPAERYGLDDLPNGLFVPRELPPPLRLPAGYLLPYYALASLAFSLHLRWPISRDTPWDPSARLALRTDEGWDDLTDDATFAALRTQGSNPFLLRYDPAESAFIADYGPAFAGIAPPLRCRFEARDGSLRATAITDGGQVHRPGDPAWDAAKRRANALDARYAVFGQHLLRTHLIVAQAFALATADLPDAHPLAPALRLHTRGTLHVNHFAWRLLFSPTSYFVQSRFIARDQLLRLVANERARFQFSEAVFPEDVSRRGIDRLPGHPYVADGAPAWEAMASYADDLAAVYPSDADLRDDPALGAWHNRLRRFFPDPDDPLLSLETRADLARLLAALVFNNVVHEVSGDYAIYLGGPRAEARRIVNFERALADDPAPPSLGDVFLFEQGAFAGTFNTAGNNLLTTAVDGFLGDPRTSAALTRLRARLAAVDTAQRERDRDRPFRFARMRPSLWELSVSF